MSVCAHLLPWAPTPPQTQVGPWKVARGAELHALLSPWAFSWMGFPTVSRGSPAGRVVRGLAAELLAERGASALWASVSSFVNWELQRSLAWSSPPGTGGWGPGPGHGAMGSSLGGWATSLHVQMFPAPAKLLSTRGRASCSPARPAHTASTVHRSQGRSPGSRPPFQKDRVPAWGQRGSWGRGLSIVFWSVR